MTSLRLGLFVLTFAVAVAPAFPQAAPEIAVPIDVESVVDSLDHDVLLGQALMVGVDMGSDYEASLRELAELIRKYKIGNIILYKESLPPQYDVVDPLTIPAYVAHLTSRLQEVAFEATGLPLFIAIDQEGAPQDPINTGVTDIPDHIHLGAARSERLALQAGCVVASELSAMGINMVLAPIADIDTTSANNFIGRRAFGANRHLVRPLAVRFMEGLQQGGVSSITKHFPGRGNSRQNPHFSLPRMSFRDLAELQNNDLDPFRALIAHGVNGILTSHILATPIDRDNPVTISNKAISGLLRGELKYDGLVLADDISFMMGILKDESGRITRRREKVAIEALEAGHDIVIFGKIYAEEDPNRPERTVTLHEFTWIYSEIAAYVQANLDLREKVQRIVKYKLALLGDTSLQEALRSVFDRRAYESLLRVHEPIAREIAESSGVLLTEDAVAINELEESKYFAEGQGPLTKGVLLSTGDRVTVVSSVFTPPDRLYEAIVREWIPEQDVSRVHMVYGWTSLEALEEASLRWAEPVKRFSWSDAFGNLNWSEEAIEEKVEEILRVSLGSKVLVMTVTRLDQIEILRRVVKSLRDTDIEIIVISYREPYLLSQELYEQRRVTVLFLPLFPRIDLATEILFGRVSPRPLPFVPVSVPGIARREIDLGAPVAEFRGSLARDCSEITKEESTSAQEGDEEVKEKAEYSGAIEETEAGGFKDHKVPLFPGLAWALLGSLGGCFLFLLVPGRKFAEHEKGRTVPRFNKQDILWTSVWGMGGVLILFLFAWGLDFFPIASVREFLAGDWSFAKLMFGGLIGGLFIPPVCIKIFQS